MLAHDKGISLIHIFDDSWYHDKNKVKYIINLAVNRRDINNINIDFLDNLRLTRAFIYFSLPLDWFSWAIDISDKSDKITKPNKFYFDKQKPATEAIRETEYFKGASIIYDSGRLNFKIRRKTYE